MNKLGLNDEGTSKTLAIHSKQIGIAFSDEINKAGARREIRLIIRSHRDEVAEYYPGFVRVGRISLFVLLKTTKI